MISRIGQTVYFTCFSDNVTWNFEGGDLPSNAISRRCGIKEYCLHITLVSSRNAGTYTCYGQDDDFLFEDNAILTISGKPSRCLILYHGCHISSNSQIIPEYYASHISKMKKKIYSSQVDEEDFLSLKFELNLLPRNCPIGHESKKRCKMLQY